MKRNYDGPSGPSYATERSGGCGKLPATAHTSSIGRQLSAFNRPGPSWFARQAKAGAGNAEPANLCPGIAALAPWSSHMLMAVFRQISRKTEGANEFDTQQLKAIMVFRGPK